MHDKSDLKSGMVIQVRNGDTYLLCDFNGVLHAIKNDSCFHLTNHRSDMKCEVNEDFDIVKVFYNGCNSLSSVLDVTDTKPIWTCGEEKEISADEAFRILKEHYGCDVKIMQE